MARSILSQNWRYAVENSNIQRAAHTLARRATDLYDAARAKVQRFIGAAEANELIFVRGTTEAVNFVADAWLRPRLVPGDEVLVSELEHHSNFLPWMRLCQQAGAVVDYLKNLALMQAATQTGDAQASVLYRDEAEAWAALGGN